MREILIGQKFKPFNSNKFYTINKHKKTSLCYPTRVHQELSVLFITSEVYPLIKTGGLGDVSAALPVALQEMGVDIRLANSRLSKSTC